jgi:trimeric autotransporter adhesin
MKSVTPTSPDRKNRIDRNPPRQLIRRQYRSAICSCAIATTAISLLLLFPTAAQAASCIAGTVFEDKDYAGGSGRSFSTTNTIGRSGARVEIYNSTGAFNSFATTDANGGYSFDCSAIASGSYTVRVVNNTVSSSRNTANVAGLIPVQTFRTNGGSADDRRVGGERPEWTDAAQGGSGTILATLTNSATKTTPQSIATVTSGTTTTGVNFGYNFDTIVNTNDSGQGSLRQFILNSNTLTGESSLPSGYETSIFMIPNGAANPGQNISYANQLTNGVAIINLTSVLPDITGTNTRLDGSTQTVNVGNTNSGTVGSIDKVGVDNFSVAKFDRPEVEIKGNFALTSTGSNNQIKSIAFNAHRIAVSGSNSLVQDNLIGMQADGTNNAATAAVTLYGITAGSNSGILIRHNYLRVNQSGIRRDGNGSNLTIDQNEVDLPSSGHTLTFDGILLIGSGSNDVVRNNLSKNQKGGGIEVGFTGGTLTNTLIENNTVFHNGYTTYGGNTPSTETMGVAAYALTTNSSVVFSKNVITQNSGAGVIVMSAAGIKLSKNSIFANGTSTNGSGLSIDLDATVRDPNSYTSVAVAGVTPNTGTMSVAPPNGGMNYPVFTRVRRVGNTLKLAGYIGNNLAGNTAFAGARIEIYKSDDDGNQNGEIIAGDTLSKPHGEGRDYIGYIVADANGLFNTTNTATPFVVDGISPTTLTATDKITATATSSATAAIAPNSSSEFSENVSLVTNDPRLVLVKRVTAIGSTAITTTIDDTRATSTAANDNNSKWPTPIDTTSGISKILQGSLTTSKVLPGQEIEYTIYFLSAGNVAIKTVNICDLIPPNTTYVTGSGKISFNGSTPPTAVSGEYIPAGAVLNTTVPGIGLCKSTVANAQTTANLSAAENPNGLVWIQVDKNRSALAENEYGYIRFRVLTNAQ